MVDMSTITMEMSALPSSEELSLAARLLIQQSVDGYHHIYGFNSASTSIYETAWVSTVSKMDTHGHFWLFPQCFKYIVENQLEDGSWGPKASPIDDILNTAASIMSLKVHLNEPLQVLYISSRQLEECIRSASAALVSLLSEWDMGASTHAGFEITVSAILSILESYGITFDFPWKARLAELHSATMSHFKPEKPYGRNKTTMAYFLEAFVGHPDFAEVGRWMIHEAVVFSPSAIAAYLRNCSQWDDHAESYLRYMVDRSCDAGGVPSGQPSPYVEFASLLPTLLRSGFTVDDLNSPALGRMVPTIMQILQRHNAETGSSIPSHTIPYIESPLTGPAPCREVDPSVISQCLLSLRLLEAEELRASGFQELILHYEPETHPQMYQWEIDHAGTAFSANCNFLLALAHEPDPIEFSPQIVKTVQSLCTCWWDANDRIRDRWNLSHLFPMMLLVDALTSLLHRTDRTAMSKFFDPQAKARVSTTIFQACFRTLIDQMDDGSWNGCVEETCYGLLILAKARHISLFEDLDQQLSISIDAAVRFISAAETGTRKPINTWSGKVGYSSTVLTTIYNLAALKAASLSPRVKPISEATFSNTVSAASMHQYIYLFRRTPLFADVAEWQLRGSVIEAALFQPLLRSQRLAIFDRTRMEEDKYFDIIPLTWIACNNRSKAFSSSSFLYEMMKISFLNYQADEHMETVAGPDFATDLGELRILIGNLFPQGKNDSNVIHCSQKKGGATSKAIDPLRGFVEQVLHNSSIANASNTDRGVLAAELQTFLQAHVTQHADNIKLRAQAQSDQFEEPSETFFNWVRTTSADHTSCPYSFAYVSCLLSSSLMGGGECFPTVTQKYFASDACRHLASMCRMYNDYGSVRRDKTERNLNSINFPEFAAHNIDHKGPKAELFKLAEYERVCLQNSISRLQTVTPTERRKMKVLEMFCDVTDLYGQIYVVKDIASPVKQPDR